MERRRPMFPRRAALVAGLAVPALPPGPPASATTAGKATNRGITENGAPVSALNAPGHSCTLAAGTLVQAQSFATAPVPTPDQQKALQEAFEDRPVPAPNRVTSPADSDPGPPVVGPGGGPKV